MATSGDESGKEQGGGTGGKKKRPIQAGSVFCFFHNVIIGQRKELLGAMAIDRSKLQSWFVACHIIRETTALVLVLVLVLVHFLFFQLSGVCLGS